MGGRVGNPGAVGFFTTSFSTLSIFLFSSTSHCSPFHHRARNNSRKIPGKWAEMKQNKSNRRKVESRLRTYHDEHARSRLITEVKHRRAWIVRDWEDRLGNPGAVGFFTTSFSTLSIFLFSSTTHCSHFHHRARNNSPKTSGK